VVLEGDWKSEVLAVSGRSGQKKLSVAAEHRCSSKETTVAAKEMCGYELPGLAGGAGGSGAASSGARARCNRRTWSSSS